MRSEDGRESVSSIESKESGTTSPMCCPVSDEFLIGLSFEEGECLAEMRPVQLG